MPRVTLLSVLPILCLSLTIVSSAGCANYIANLIYAWRGDNTPAEYPGCKGKKIAIVCGTERGLSNDANATLLTRYVAKLMGEHVKDATIIDQEKVEKWLDSRGWRETDYEEIGKGVGADKVVSIDLRNLTLRDGMTLYKGRADISVTVYDVAEEGKVVFRKTFPNYEYPTLDGPSVIDTTEARFQVLFLTVVSKRIATLFYDADPKEQFALDAISSSF